MNAISKPPESWIEAQLLRAIEDAGGLWTIPDLVALAAQGRIQVWGNGTSAVACTEVRDFPRRRALHLFLVAGHLADVLAMEPRIVAFAREQGCTVMWAEGRLAWRRIGGPIGWHPRAVGYIKYLETGEGGHA